MNKYLKTITAVLVVLNVALIIIVSDQNSLIKNIESDGYSASLVRIQTGIENNQNKLEAFRNKSIQLITIIDERGCTTCIDHEVKLLNSYAKKFENKITVIFLGTDPNHLRNKYGATFKYYTLRSSNELFGETIPIWNPYSLLLDNNFIYNFRVVNTARPFNKELSTSFYSGIEKFLNQL